MNSPPTLRPGGGAALAATGKRLVLGTGIASVGTWQTAGYAAAAERLEKHCTRGGYPGSG